MRLLACFLCVISILSAQVFADTKPVSKWGELTFNYLPSQDKKILARFALSGTAVSLAVLSAAGSGQPAQTPEILGAALSMGTFGGFLSAYLQHRNQEVKSMLSNRGLFAEDSVTIKTFRAIPMPRGIRVLIEFLIKEDPSKRPFPLEAFAKNFLIGFTYLSLLQAATEAAGITSTRLSPVGPALAAFNNLFAQGLWEVTVSKLDKGFKSIAFSDKIEIISRRTDLAFVFISGLGTFASVAQLQGYDLSKPLTLGMLISGAMTLAAYEITTRSKTCQRAMVSIAKRWRRQ